MTQPVRITLAALDAAIGSQEDGAGFVANLERIVATTDRELLVVAIFLRSTGRRDSREPELSTLVTGGGTRGGLMAVTAREREVLALIAAGKTNREIAKALTIAPATASRHVQNIFEKLGMSRRSEAAAWWAQQGF